MTLTGWIFDAYPEDKGMAVWLVDRTGRSHKLAAPFSPGFFLDSMTDAVRDSLSRIQVPIDIADTRRKDLYSNEEQTVAHVTIHCPLAYPPVVAQLQRQFPEREFFTCDIDVESLFFYQTGWFPLAKVSLEVDKENWILDWHLDDDPWSLDYTLPPLSVMELGLEESSIHPKQAQSCSAVRVRVDGVDLAIEPGYETKELRRLLERYNPHLIVTDWGDDFLLKELSTLKGFSRIPFNVDKTILKQRGKARSYFTYGKVVYSAPSYFFRGRWHVDRQNSFVVHEAGFEGLFELARLSKMPVQKVARLSTGSVISQMQLETALKLGYLIPWRKATVEEPKTAEELLVIDKGGLVYQPKPGLYENVAEIDFSSMYPTLMHSYNLSPETVNCPCCAPSHDVPEAGYHTCKKRIGIVPLTIKPLLDKRAAYKARMKSEADSLIREAFERRQTAIKWLLVTCFGYLGYKNARFGKIEAHESTTALGREKLLQAKEAAEERGFTMLHALTDSIWVEKKGATLADYEKLAASISAHTRIPAVLEGVYRWLVFAPSKENPKAGVPNRFFGVFSDGKSKIRGIEARRSDTCPFVREAQQKMLDVLFQAKGKEEYLALAPKVLGILETSLAELRGGRVPVQKLALSRRLSREPLEYEKASTTAIAAQELAALGMEIHAGEKIRLIMTDADAAFYGDRVKALALWDGSRGYDAEWYGMELLKAAASVLFPAGQDLERLKRRCLELSSSREKTQKGLWESGLPSASPVGP